MGVGGGVRGAWLPDSGSGMLLDFYIVLHTRDWVQLREAGRTLVSRGPFPRFRETRRLSTLH